MNRWWRISPAVLALFVSTNLSYGAGFEKAVFWDAHYAAIAGAAQSSVTGPQALYWNPAGLAGLQGVSINGDLSPTASKFSGPFAGTNLAAVDSNTSVTLPGGAFVGYGVTPQWGVAIGYYVSAANRADYDNVNVGLPAISYTPSFRGDLTITELSVGAAYELLPGLKFGFGYRLLFVSGEISSARGIALGGGNFELVGLHTDVPSTTRSGFRVGLEWAPAGSPFGLGVVYRNQVRFNASSSASVTTASSNGVAGPTAPAAGANAGTGEQVLVSGVLPQRVDAAAHYRFCPDFTGFLGYSFTNYSQEQTLGISGVTISGQPQSDASTSLPFYWTNMHNVRFGGEFAGVPTWPIRAGFVWTSEVTPKGNALPIVASPGNGYTVIAGTGHRFTPTFSMDGAFEYSWDSGSVATADNPNSALTQVGDYSAKAYAVHLSATVAF